MVNKYLWYIQTYCYSSSLLTYIFSKIASKMFWCEEGHLSFGRMDVGFKANCPLVGPGSTGGLPSVAIFLRDHIPCLWSFGENHGKLLTVRSTSATGDWIWHFPFTSLRMQNCSATGGTTDRQSDIHGLPGIRTRNLWCCSRLPIRPLGRPFFRENTFLM